ncbi:hypothetical protein SK128_003935 [Halocaridina rubra]|uniref:Sulfatase N-terminal domain-containing protein n=1 Tax=Halocaridina rubra TaxID=373956 RepID=A0AAN9A9P8_HALRR
MPSLIKAVLGSSFHVLSLVSVCVKNNQRRFCVLDIPLVIYVDLEAFSIRVTTVFKFQLCAMLWIVIQMILFCISLANCKEKPHLILIVADDLGWNDVSWHNPSVATPHLEELARGGVILNQSYVLPICTPTRSALMTGRYPFTIGRQRSTIRPSEPTGLLLNATLLPQSLKKAGYSTHVVGKWHLGFCSWSYTPTYRSFDTFYGYYNGAEDYFTHLRNCLHATDCNNCTSSEGEVHFGLDLRNNTTPDPNKEGIYSPHLFASYVEDLLESRNAKEPMFLYFPFQSVHAPLMVPKNYTKPYKYIHDHDRRVYLGMVSALDEAVGRVVQALKSTGHYNNSVIVFTTDNGGTCHHGGNNWPLRGMKSTFWEGGTRGVAFVHSPLLPNPGTVSNTLVHATDWFKTFVKLAGGEAPSVLDGFDQWEAISGLSTSPRKQMVYNIDDTDKLRAAVRMGDYKLLVGNPGEGDWTPPPEMLERTKNAINFVSDQSHLPESLFLKSVERGHSGVDLPKLYKTFNKTSLKNSKLSDGSLIHRPGKLVKQNRDSAKRVLRSADQKKEPYIFTKKGLARDLVQFRTSFSRDYSNSFVSELLDQVVDNGNTHKEENKDRNASENNYISKTSENTSRNHGSNRHPEVQNNQNSYSEENDAVLWQDLANEYLVNDAWFKNQVSSYNVLKNDTEIRLYNIIDDPEERSNLAQKKVNTVKILLEFLLKEFMNRYAPADVPDEVPEANPKYWNNTWSPGWCIPK